LIDVNAYPVHAWPACECRASIGLVIHAHK
jgi:hypothetical protein